MSQLQKKIRHNRVKFFRLLCYCTKEYNAHIYVRNIKVAGFWCLHRNLRQLGLHLPRHKDISRPQVGPEFETESSASINKKKRFLSALYNDCYTLFLREKNVDFLCFETLALTA